MRNKAMIAALAALLCLSLAPLKAGAREAPPVKAAGVEPAGAGEAGSDVSLYVVGGAVLLIWLGVSACLWRMDRRISRLEKKIHEG